MNRKIAIICYNTENNVNQILQSFSKDTSIDIFYFEKTYNPNWADFENVSYIKMTDDVSSVVKSKNFVLNYYKNIKFDNYLHILEDTIEILKDPSTFINDIENCLSILDLNTYLCTITDACNRVYSKYNPRVCLKLDKPEYSKFNLPSIIFCSHSNTQWMIFNMAKADEEELHFNDQFEIAMYWIIEYLARRRNTHPDTLYYMNQYVTVESEHGVFRNKTLNSSDKNTSKENFEKEDKMFRELNIDYSPDNNIDILLEKIYHKLNSKL